MIDYKLFDGNISAVLKFKRALDDEESAQVMALMQDAVDARAKLEKLRERLDSITASVIKCTHRGPEDGCPQCRMLAQACRHILEAAPPEGDGDG
jgi:hypothetical protein